jgi:hypothetical protein
MHLHMFQCNNATHLIKCISGCQNYPGHLIGCECGASVSWPACLNTKYKVRTGDDRHVQEDDLMQSTQDPDTTLDFKNERNSHGRTIQKE